MKRICIVFFALICSLSVSSQVFNKMDKAVFKSTTNGFYETVIMPSVKVNSKPVSQTFLSMEFPGNYPTNIANYETLWHIIPKSQGNTGTCWCFAATSFLESEIMRQQSETIDLSEMYFVYWEYVDRALDFVQTRGETYFEQGSEANALKRLIPKYGFVPEFAYPGKPKYREFHSHGEMLAEMKTYLNGVKISGEWNEKLVEAGIRSILDAHMGEVPEEFTFNNQIYTAQSFYEFIDVDVLGMFSFMSTMSAPYGQKAELVEPDNWWHSDDYYNVELDDYYQIIENAVKSGYSICICGDVSEPGYNSRKEVALVPDFDIPAEYINESSRELRLNNKSTTDDHCIHIVGYQNVDDETWFLIKDSGSGGFDGKNKGYRFYHEDYIRLKMMNIMLHKDAARSVLDGIIK
ncbi:MAG: C1 family peptidase [Bacteroidota bacterium]|nr:C1 family peptidase [Bacteroidota bacterium]